MNTVAPSTSDGIDLVAHFGDEGHYCVSQATTLKELWCTPFVSSCYTPVLRFNTSRPLDCTFKLLPNNALVVVDNGSVVSFHAATGKEMWKYELPNKDNKHVSKSSVDIAGDSTQVVVTHNGVFSLNATTGELRYVHEGDAASFSPHQALAKDGSVLLYDVQKATLLSREGKVLQRYIPPPLPNNGAISLLQGAHITKSTGQVALATTNIVNGSSSATLLMFNDAGKLIWKQHIAAAQNLGVLLDESRNTMWYSQTEDPHFVGRNMTTGEIVASSTAFNACLDTRPQLVPVGPTDNGHGAAKTGGRTLMLSGSCPFDVVRQLELSSVVAFYPDDFDVVP